MNQIELHTIIDTTLAKGVASVISDDIYSLIGANDDAKQYFFSKADEKWLGWLWKNGFLDAIKEKSLDPSSYGFRMPELNYLFRVSEKESDIVTDIICSFQISSNNFNPEVVDQLTRIAGKLPTKCLEKIVPKIKNEGWIKLMGSYTQYGFEYADMLKTLNGDKAYESILILSEAMLQIRNKKDITERKYSYRGDDVFFIHDLSETGIFTYLAEVPDKYLEQALSITIKAFVEAVQDEGDYILMDEDFFNFSLKAVMGHNFREELKFLAATIVELVKKIFSNNDFDHRKIYIRYFANLSKSQTTRRLKLFVLSLDPKLFIKELKSEYFKLFEVKKPLEILYGAEYERSLKAGFSYLPDLQKREYIAKVFDLFSKPKDDEDKRWKRHYASCILSTVSSDLDEKEIVLAKLKEYKIDPKYLPEPSVGHIRGGTVTPQSPISSDDFSKLSVSDIASRLMNELSPEVLQKKYNNDDFQNPRDADGVAEQLKGDIKNRLDDYLKNSPLFFDRERLIPHYTYSFLRGVKEAIAEQRVSAKELNFDKLIDLLQIIRKSGEAESFTEKNDNTDGRWLSGWSSVHSTIADLIEELIKLKDKITLINFKKHRKNILEVLSYLLGFNDPIPEDEKLKTAKMTTKRPSESEASISDPFSIAINSVRGEAFQTLLHFIYQDAKLADDVKSLYINLLQKEDTRAIMFMFGHYLPIFHYRDIDWVKGRFSKIFEHVKKDKYLHLAVWEGYLSNNLYRELFFEPYFQKLYGKNITLNLSYPNQKFFKDPHESIAIHFALAFVYYEEFGFDHPLFKKFIKKADAKQLSEFINFLGRSYVAGEYNNIFKDKNSLWRLDRIKNFWNLMLKTKSDSPSLKEFGTWISAGNEVLDIVWLTNMINQTLKLTNGDLRWDYGLLKSVEKLATEASQDALEILEKRFLFVIRDKKNQFPIRTDKEWYSAFEILYKNEETRSKTYNLINELIEKGGRPFWNLEEIVR